MFYRYGQFWIEVLFSSCMEGSTWYEWVWSCKVYQTYMLIRWIAAVSTKLTTNGIISHLNLCSISSCDAPLSLSHIPEILGILGSEILLSCFLGEIWTCSQINKILHKHPTLSFIVYLSISISIFLQAH